MRVFKGEVLALSLSALIQTFASTLAIAEDWVVAKSTGQVWHATSGATPVAIGAETRMAPGDLIQTGPTGRVMLTRGTERILVAPNSVISLPTTEDKPGFTTILQKAGAIAIEAEKKDHKHFEVLTPYLAAVVKGTQFTVTVRGKAADVNVASGKVEVAELKTGKTALVLPGQFAQVGVVPGLKLGGSGTFEPITQGTPRTPSVAPAHVPKQGLRTPPAVQGLRVDAVKSNTGPRTGAVRIEKTLGPMTLDASSSTAGLVRTDGVNRSTATIWKPAGESGSAITTNTSSGVTASNTVSTPAAGLGTPTTQGTMSTPGNPAGSSAAVFTGAPTSSGGLSSPGLSTAIAASSNANLGLSNDGKSKGNAYGLHGGNGIGKALGLGHKSN